MEPQLAEFADIQLRNINYRINGFRYNPSYLSVKYSFQTKIGVTLHKQNRVVYLYALAGKEPNRGL
jgi:hypothetical protein